MTFFFVFLQHFNLFFIFFQCSTSLVIKVWICFILFDVIQKGTTQCFEIFYLFVCFLLFLCAVKALILWGALWAGTAEVFWLVVVFLLLRATTRWNISDAVFWWPGNQNAVFSTCEKRSEGTSSEGAQVFAATISLPNSSEGGSRPGLDPSVSSVLWQADDHWERFSQVEYLVLYVSISFVCDCTKCLCWLFAAVVDVVVVEGSRLKRGRGLGDTWHLWGSAPMFL